LQTGLIWAPCAGPVLGLILTGAALRGPSVETSLLLLTYGLGAATSLAAGARLSGRLLASVKRSIRRGDGLRRVLGAAVIVGTAAVWLGFDTSPPGQWSSATASRLEQALIVAPEEDSDMVVPAAHAAPAHALSGPLADLLGAKQWLNTPPLRPTHLRGHVILVNFWTYSCINCLRVLPHVRAWAQTYGERGLLVVSVHTPEFAFEKDAANVSQALAELGVTYPTAIDSDFAIWRAFGNQAWPALYFIDTDGRIRHRVRGEGSYEQSERLIQRLLSEAAAAPVSIPIARAGGSGAQAEADAANLRSAETYIGYAQATGFAPADGLQRDVPAEYQTVSPLAINRWALAGTWTIGGEFATLNVPAGRIACRFHARDLHLVLAPSAPARSIRFRVTLDGVPPGADHGADVDAQGWGSVHDGRLYQLIRQSGPVMDRTFEIEFFNAGVHAYVFTFG
jgi:thiol-disulfide isomerase/thioredoxin